MEGLSPDPVVHSMMVITKRQALEVTYFCGHSSLAGELVVVGVRLTTISAHRAGFVADVSPILRISYWFVKSHWLISSLRLGRTCRLFLSGREEG